MSDQPPKKGRGCFFYGCITGIILMLLVTGVLLLGFWYVKKLINTYTDTKPVALPRVEMPQEQVGRLQKRFNEFIQGVDQNKPVPPLILTGDEINVLIANSANTKSMQDKVHLSIEGDQVKGQVSFPLSQLGLPFLKGRYLNGAGTFKVVFQNGELKVTAESIVVQGKPLPESFMAGMKNQNLAEGFTKEPKNAEALGKLDSIQVKDGAVTVLAKPKN